MNMIIIYIYIYIFSEYRSANVEIRDLIFLATYREYVSRKSELNTEEWRRKIHGEKKTKMKRRKNRIQVNSIMSLKKRSNETRKSRK